MSRITFGWSDNDGIWHRVNTMTISHLRNALNYCANKDPSNIKNGLRYLDWIRIFQEELEYRKPTIKLYKHLIL
jgi:hypothetical protein